MSRTFERIQRLVAEGNYETTVPHLFDELEDDGFVLEDAIDAVCNGSLHRTHRAEGAETRFEIWGSAKDGRKLAVVCKFLTDELVLLITAFRVVE